MKTLRTIFLVTSGLMGLLLTPGCSTDAMNDLVADSNPTGSNPESAYPTDGQVGTSAADLLSSGTYSSILIEIAYTDAYAPQAQTLENLQAFLQELLNKPGGVTLHMLPLGSTGKERLTAEDIRQLEARERTAFTSGRQLAVFALFADAEYDTGQTNGTVLGIAYQNTSVALFGSSIQAFSDQPLEPSRTVLETTVLNHEFGHLLGLVNAGTPMQTDHQDVEHGRHCTSDTCLMYWTAETGEGILNMLSGGTVPPLDAACKTDLTANGGK
ncbi:membrane metalloprotease [Robiginitalea sp. M366]|uniref:membrane metalloprotease n=1 Tax=Robiginitalea aestuariiviva TaxID=3036903 RepID=UPI00240D56C6|nr:membrane metalloprotease [Robiginitalea aestuariiviva]MDG1571864.1 membrane metalloprotease [Robiginitalea aestuariiviva]